MRSVCAIDDPLPCFRLLHPNRAMSHEALRAIGSLGQWKGLNRSKAASRLAQRDHPAGFPEREPLVSLQHPGSKRRGPMRGSGLSRPAALSLRP